MALPACAPGGNTVNSRARGSSPRTGWAKRLSRKTRGSRVHLDTATGVRPSPGAAEPGLPSGLGCFDTALFADPAAPEDGHTPAQPQLVVVLSRCARWSGPTAFGADKWWAGRYTSIGCAKPLPIQPFWECRRVSIRMAESPQ